MADAAPNETDIARLIASGDLPSPQKFENMWLFALRISGVRAAYRKALNEYTWRDPAYYTSEAFLSRCNGLPVILDHPESKTLNSKEFNNRVIGAIMLPFVKDGEPWGVARIYDEPSAIIMQEIQLSTSPGVSFCNSLVNSKVLLDDGSELLIEGEPPLLDHLAVCEQGVWDKGGDPVGVSINGEPTVSEKEPEKTDAASEEKKEEKTEAKADAASDTNAKLDALIDSVKTMGARMDAVHTRMDSLETAAKAPRADAAEEGAAEKANQVKEDAAKADAEALRARMDAAEEALKERSDEDAAAMADAQAKCDSVAVQFGKQAPAPMRGEKLAAYRIRLAREYQSHSPHWKGADLSKIAADSVAFATIEQQIYADASAAARNPQAVPLGELREVIRRNGAHTIHEFVGKPSAWMDQFKSVTHRARFNSQKAA